MYVHKFVINFPEARPKISCRDTNSRESDPPIINDWRERRLVASRSACVAGDPDARNSRASGGDRSHASVRLSRSVLANGFRRDGGRAGGERDTRRRASVRSTT